MSNLLSPWDIKRFKENPPANLLDVALSTLSELVEVVKDAQTIKNEKDAAKSAKDDASRSIFDMVIEKLEPLPKCTVGNNLPYNDVTSIAGKSTWDTTGRRPYTDYPNWVEVQHHRLAAELGAWDNAYQIAHEVNLPKIAHNLVIYNALMNLLSKFKVPLGYDTVKFTSRGRKVTTNSYQFEVAFKQAIPTSDGYIANQAKDIQKKLDEWKRTSLYNYQQYHASQVNALKEQQATNRLSMSRKAVLIDKYQEGLPKITKESTWGELHNALLRANIVVELTDLTMCKTYIDAGWE